MAAGKERRRALARAKWERQQARRTAAQQRARRLGIIGGAAMAVAVIALVGWGGYSLATGGDDGGGQPTDNFPTMLQPSVPGVTAFSYSPPSGQPSGTPSNGTPASPTEPTSTGTSSP